MSVTGKQTTENLFFSYCKIFFFQLEVTPTKRSIHDVAYCQQVYGGVSSAAGQQWGEGGQPPPDLGQVPPRQRPQPQTEQVAGGLGTMGLRKAREDLRQMGPGAAQANLDELRRLARKLYGQLSASRPSNREQEKYSPSAEPQHVAPVLSSEVYTCVPCARVFCSHRAFSAHVGASGKWSQCRKFEYVQHKLGDVHDRQAHVGLIGRQVSGGEEEVMEQRDPLCRWTRAPRYFLSCHEQPHGALRCALVSVTCYKYSMHITYM